MDVFVSVCLAWILGTTVSCNAYTQTVTPNILTPSDFNSNITNLTTSWTFDDLNSTVSYELTGLELLDHLFNTQFHADVDGTTCFDKLRDYNHYTKLTPFQRLCLCRLVCVTPMLGVDYNARLSPEDKARQAELERKAQEQKDETKFEEILPLTSGVTASYAFCTLVGIVGNLMVLITVAKFMQKPSVTYIFICSISCSDLLVCAICAPLKMYKRLNSTVSSSLMCRIMNHLYFMSLACSAFSLLAMSMERYLVICHPMKAQSVSTNSRAKKIIMALWFGAAIVATPFTYFTDAGSNCIILYPGVTDTVKYVVTFGMGVVFYVGPVVVMTFAYLSVSVALYRSIKLSKSLQNKGDKMNGKETKKAADDASGRVAVIRMLVLVLVMFVLCLGPFWIFSMLDVTPAMPPELFGYEKTVVLSVCNILAYLNSVINPLLYAFSSRPMRIGFINCFRICCGKPPRSVKDPHTKSVTMSSSVSMSSSVNNISGTV